VYLLHVNKRKININVLQTISPKIMIFLALYCTSNVSKDSKPTCLSELSPTQPLISRGLAWRYGIQLYNGVSLFSWISTQSQIRGWWRILRHKFEVDKSDCLLHLVLSAVKFELFRDTSYKVWNHEVSCPKKCILIIK